MRTLITLCFCCLLSLNVFAQEKEAGVFVGATAFQGDLVESVADFKELSIGYGAFYRFYTSSKFSFRLGVTAGTFTSDDANGDKASRGYSSKSSIIDATAMMEWNILGINIYGPTAFEQNNFSPYFVLGVGAAMYNPEVTTTTTDLRPLDASKEYAAYSMVVPMGIGVKYATEKITVGVEGVLRAGLSDYLDGISKSGNPNDNDWYGFYGVNAAYRLGNIPAGGARSQETPKEMEEFESTEEEEMGSYSGK